MTKTLPISGDLRRLNNNDQAIIRFALPSDCPLANPPLEVCFVVWDNSPCNKILDSLPNAGRCDGDYAGSAGVNRAGLTNKGRARFCSSRLLSQWPGRPGIALTDFSVLIRLNVGSVHEARRQNTKDYLSVIMYNPTRLLAIPISND